MASPKLRFKEFDRDWERSKLGNKAKFFQGEQVSLDDQYIACEEGLIKFLRIENFTQNSKDFRFIKYDGSPEKILCKEDIAIVRYGATAGFIGSDEEGVIANNLFKVVADSKIINQKYLKLILKSDKTFNYFQSEMSGGAMPALNFKIVGNLDIAFPCLEEQAKIASFLSAVDEKINLLTQKHELLSQYKQGIMQKLFSQQIRFKADDGSEFGKWEKKKLGDIALKVGSGSTPRGGNEAYTAEGIIFIRSQNVNNDQLLLNDIVYISENTHKKMSGSKVVANDILLNITGSSIGRSCVVPHTFTEANVNQHVCIIRVPNDNPRFIQSFLSSKAGQDLIHSHQAGSGREGLNFQSIRAFVFQRPCLEEQTKIANFLSAIDQKIAGVAQQIEQAKQWKKGLLQQMFV
nr:restriction endonuclease subunit S [Acinetobacter sp. YH01020]